MKNLRERYIATLVGCGTGDALGMPVEGWKKEQIKEHVGKICELLAPVLVRDSEGSLVEEDKFGKLKCYTPDLELGEYTDDTHCTLAIAEAIAEKKKLDLEHITYKQIEVYDKCKQQDGHIRGGWGGSTKEAFERIKSGTPISEAGAEPGLGTGPCMKISPIGLYMDATGKYNEGLKTAREIGQTTHKDERAIATGVVQAAAIYQLLQEDLKREEFLDYLILLSQTRERPFNQKVLPEKGTLTSRLKWIKDNRNLEDNAAHDYLKSSGQAIESYPFTIFMFQKYWETPVEGLIETVNFGGDCDTTGAMYGALAGAKNGMVFPEEWTNCLQNKDKLEAAAEKIHSLKNVQ